MNTLTRWARAEWGPLYVTVRETVTRRGWRAVAMSIGAVCLTAALQLRAQPAVGLSARPERRRRARRGTLWLALLRTPLSLFVPALDLPVRGALVPILLVFGIAEICLGRWRTLALA